LPTKGTYSGKSPPPSGKGYRLVSVGEKIKGKEKKEGNKKEKGGKTKRVNLG
jgi:hypothetical protein